MAEARFGIWGHGNEGWVSTTVPSTTVHSLDEGNAILWGVPGGKELVGEGRRLICISLRCSSPNKSRSHEEEQSCQRKPVTALLQKRHLDIQDMNQVQTGAPCGLIST